MRNIDFEKEFYNMFKELSSDMDGKAGDKEKNEGKYSVLKLCWHKLNVLCAESEQKIKEMKEEGRQPIIANNELMKELAAKARQRKKDYDEKMIFADRIKDSLIEELQEKEMP